MLFPPVPLNERIRLQALRELNILDSSPDERFDFITRFAARLLKVPICLISLVDENRQWFKSNEGLEVRETPRYMSFCAHAICETSSLIPESRIFEIHNASADTRFSDNPLVTGAPMIQSYIGFVLLSKSSMSLGTFCFIDTKPRVYVGEEKSFIKTLGVIIQNLINDDQYFLN